MKGSTVRQSALMPVATSMLNGLDSHTTTCRVNGTPSRADVCSCHLITRLCIVVALVALALACAFLP